MHILALGGNSFIGSHLVGKLVVAGHEVSVLSRREDPRWPHGQLFRHLPGGFEELLVNPKWLDGVDAVFHGAWSTVPKTAAADPVIDLQTNVSNTILLFKMLGNAPSVKHLLFLSSGGAIYGNVDHDYPIPETQPLNPISAYGIGKMAAEKYCQVLAASSDLDLTIIRPSNPYGPGQSAQGALGVVSTFLKHVMEGTPATMFGDGSTVRDFIDVRDLARLLVTALDAPVPGVYNAGSGIGSSIAQVATEVEAVSGRSLKFNRLPERPFDPKRIVLDVSSAKDRFGWLPRYSIEDGVRNLFSYWNDYSKN